MEPCLRSVCRESLRKVSMKCWTWRPVKCSRSSVKRPLTAACGRTHHSTLLQRVHGPCCTTRVKHFFLLPDFCCRQRATDASQAALSSVAPVFVVVRQTFVHLLVLITHTVSLGFTNEALASPRLKCMFQ